MTIADIFSFNKTTRTWTTNTHPTMIRSYKSYISVNQSSEIILSDFLFILGQKELVSRLVYDNRLLTNEMIWNLTDLIESQKYSDNKTEKPDERYIALGDINEQLIETVLTYDIILYILAFVTSLDVFALCHTNKWWYNKLVNHKFVNKYKVNKYLNFTAKHLSTISQAHSNFFMFNAAYLVQCNPPVGNVIPPNDFNINQVVAYIGTSLLFGNIKYYDCSMKLFKFNYNKNEKYMLDITHLIQLLPLEYYILSHANDPHINYDYPLNDLCTTVMLYHSVIGTQYLCDIVDLVFCKKVILWNCEIIDTNNGYNRINENEGDIHLFIIDYREWYSLLDISLIDYVCDAFNKLFLNCQICSITRHTMLLFEHLLSFHDDESWDNLEEVIMYLTLSWKAKITVSALLNIEAWWIFLIKNFTYIHNYVVSNMKKFIIYLYYIGKKQNYGIILNFHTMTSVVELKKFKQTWNNVTGNYGNSKQHFPEINNDSYQCEKCWRNTISTILTFPH